MYGGMAQGFGQVLMEGIVYTPEGQPLAGSLMDYAILRAGALPLTLEKIWRALHGAGGDERDAATAAR